MMHRPRLRAWLRYVGSVEAAYGAYCVEKTCEGEAGVGWGEVEDGEEGGAVEEAARVHVEREEGVNPGRRISVSTSSAREERRIGRIQLRLGRFSLHASDIHRVHCLSKTYHIQRQTTIP